MAEPATTTGAIAYAVWGGFAGALLAALFPGADLNTVIGAFGGSFAFMLFSMDTSAFHRLGFLLVGWIGGYYGAGELLARQIVSSPGFAGFGAGLVCVVASMAVLRGVPPFVREVMRRVAGLFGKGAE